MARTKRDPRTKEEFLDRILRYDFDGDIRNIGAEPASIVRTGPNSLRLTFPESDTTFEISVHRPREFSQAARSPETRTFSRQEEPEVRQEEPEAPEPPKPKRKYTRKQREAPGAQH